MVSSTSTTTKLHISPLTPDLLSTILPAPLLAHATSISYHTLPTFPERNYGYIELPTPDAAALKKKLHGAILRGAKMHVDDARPAKRALRSDALVHEDHNGSGSGAAGHDGGGEGGRKKRRPAEKEPNVIPAIELSEKRKVKRGWTEGGPSAKSKSTSMSKSKSTSKSKSGSTSKESKQKGKSGKDKTQSSTYTDGPECLFRAKLPPTAAGNTLVRGGKPKKRKPGAGNGDGKEAVVVVHEFANTTKHASFLRSGGAATAANAPAAKFVEGRGWVDEHDALVEEEPKSLRRTGRRAAKHADQEGEQEGNDEASGRIDDNDETSSSGTSISASSSSHADDDPTTTSTAAAAAAVATKPATRRAPATTTKTAKTTTQPSSLLPATPTITTTSAPALSPPPPVHPLEALFKRPKAHANAATTTGSSTTAKKPPNLDLAIPFSFFDSPAPASTGPGTGTGTGGGGNSARLPNTPFTQRDLQWRGMRSAAPTPDTAAPRRSSFGFGFGMAEEEAESGEGDDDDVEMKMEEEEEEEEEEEREGKRALEAVHEADEAGGDEATGLQKGQEMRIDRGHEDGKGEGNGEGEGEGESEKPESEFSKWFWEHRGETNRAWKRRRREMAKEKRQRENRRRTRSAA